MQIQTAGAINDPEGGTCFRNETKSAAKPTNYSQPEKQQKYEKNNQNTFSVENVLKQKTAVNVFFHKQNSKKLNHGLVMQKSVTRGGLGILQGLFCSIQIWIDITWRSDPFLDQDP